MFQELSDQPRFRRRRRTLESDEEVDRTILQFPDPPYDESSQQETGLSTPYQITNPSYPSTTPTLSSELDERISNEEVPYEFSIPARGYIVPLDDSGDEEDQEASDDDQEREENQGRRSEEVRSPGSEPLSDIIARLGPHLDGLRAVNRTSRMSAHAQVIRPPRRGSKDAPSFDGSDPKALPRYIEDIEMIAADAGLDDAGKVRYAKYYASTEVAELWDTLAEVKKTQPVWTSAKTEMMELYPSLTTGKRYSAGEFEQLVATWAEKGIKSREELGQYRREFSIRASYLEAVGTITAKEAKHAFLRGITGELRAMVMRRLEIKDPDHGYGEPFNIEVIAREADYILGGATIGAQTFNATHATLATTSATLATGNGSSATVKKEEVNLSTVLETLKSFQLQLDALGRTGAPRQGQQGSTSGQRPPCAFCGEPGHFIRSCAKVLEYIRVGKCARNAEGRVVQPDGSYIASSIPGRTLMERLDNLAKDKTQTVNMISIADSRSTETRTETATAIIAEVEEDGGDEMEIERLQCMLNEAKKKANVRKQKGDDSSKGKGPQQGSTKQNASQPSTSAHGAAQRSDITKNVADRGQYKYSSAIEDPAVARLVLERSLDNKITLSQRELLALSSEMRRQYKDLTITKRVPVEEAHMLDSQLAQPDSQPPQRVTEPGYIAVNEGWASAKEALPLRTVRALVEGLVEIDCILDQGASVNIIREDVWKRLQIPLEPKKCLSLESANTGVDKTLGLVEGAAFCIAGIQVSLPVQVVKTAPFQALLGRPFFAVTECETKDFEDGEQHITLTDPRDRDRQCKVATGIRKVCCDDLQDFREASRN